MNRSHVARFRSFAALGILTAALALSGCYNPFSPRIAPVLGRSTPAPVPSSAPGALRLFEWCYNNRAIAEYRELFTDDYRFYFSPLDSAGAEYRGTPFTREDELISATQLFVGGSADQPPASSIRLTLDKNFFVYPDPSYTKWDVQGRWHKNIRTQVALRIETGDANSIEVSGAANFYMVRGDSAVIPDELRLLGFGPDSNRWYIRRWDDETAQPEIGAFAARPAGGASLSAWRSAAARREAPTVGEPSDPATAAPLAARAGFSVPARAGRERLASGFDDFPTTLVASWGYAKVYYLSRPRVSPAGRGSAGP